ncbi:MAG: DUF192 domain-containing protein [Deltaproteobacteria bacterium]|nr:DUF192 domain-containing protein [Deltaproteobacteria bacterium]MBI3075386.1 DUF192 domain-containing protein [Deltaproteobacteria bacterium]
MRAINTTTGRPLAIEVRVLTGLSRLRGLMFARGLRPGQALLLPRCRAIHTGFVREPIDVVFLEATGHVLRLCDQLRPFRVRTCPGACAVLELPAGSAARTQTSVGDQVVLQ